MTPWGCEHSIHAVCWLCAGPDEGPRWWRNYLQCGSRWANRERWIIGRKYDAIRRQKLVANA